MFDKNGIIYIWFINVSVSVIYNFPQISTKDWKKKNSGKGRKVNSLRFPNIIFLEISIFKILMTKREMTYFSLKNSGNYLAKKLAKKV